MKPSSIVLGVLGQAAAIAAVWFFLRRARAALIPGVAVPVSLIGTFAVMYLFGYSIDNRVSRKLAFEDVANVVARSFTRWTSASCATEGASATRVSIDVREGLHSA